MPLPALGLQFANTLEVGSTKLALRDPFFNLIGILTVTSKYRPDKVCAPCGGRRDSVCLTCWWIPEAFRVRLLLS
jgi:hypothetical protein